MSKDMIKSMKHSLLCCAQGQMSHLDKVDAKELGEVIDMIKDLEEAMYYCVITEAMLKQGHEEKQESIYYSDPYHVYYKDNSSHEKKEKHHMKKDHREGKSPMCRCKYMEAKEMHHDKNIQLQELEKYMQELSNDIIEMIDDASVEEKKYLANKISALATKVSKLDG